LCLPSCSLYPLPATDLQLQLLPTIKLLPTIDVLPAINLDLYFLPAIDL
jgi:hypothetical protein